MKADLTRDTFHPLKHFARVLTQQGRVQLDADMNEQAAILLRLLANSGGRSDWPGRRSMPKECGFAITPVDVTPLPTRLIFRLALAITM